VGGGGSSDAIDELLDRAVRAINSGDRDAAAALAGQVLAVDHDNPDAEELLTTFDEHGEIRRLTLVFIDLVDSTVLSTRVEPEIYRTLVGGFRDQTVAIVSAYDGHIFSSKGDGLLAVFGHPTAHERDVERAVSAGLDVTRAVARLSLRAERDFGVPVEVRVGIHRGLVYLDTINDDVYGFAANFASRISGLAEPGTVAVSDTVAALIGDSFDVAARAPAQVKGVDVPVTHHRVLAERPQGPPPRRVPICGRVSERAWLERTWQQVAVGAAPDTRGVVFLGDAGIGKTRLVRVATELVEQSGGEVIELRGSPLHSGTGLHPVRRLLERRCGISRLTEEAERLRLLEAELRARSMDPATTLPLLAPVLGVDPAHDRYRPAVVEGRTLYELIRKTVNEYVLACLKDQPGLVVAEDLHWFDPSTVELLGALLNSESEHAMFVLTGRDRARVNSEWPVEVLELKPLTDNESDALIDALDPVVTDAQRAEVRSRCDGVPFYIEHVIAALDAADGDRQVPEALYESVFAGLHMRPDVGRIVEAAAVIGRSGDAALLRSVVGTDVDANVDDIVAELIRARVFEGSGHGGWRFRHELQREVAAELAPPSRRREQHARAAHALAGAATVAQPDWQVVAGHYDQAGRFDDAVGAYRRAALSARRRGALSEATAFLTDALDRLTSCSCGPARDRTEIAIRLERGYLEGATQGTWSGAAPADFEQCLALAAGGDYEDELVSTLTAMVGYYLPRAELRRANELLNSLSARITRDRPWSVPAIASALGSVSWLRGDFRTARDHLVQALADRSEADPQVLQTSWWSPVEPISSAHLFLALSHMVRGELPGADAELAASARRCDDLDFPQSAQNRAHTYFMEVWVRLEFGQLSEAGELVDELRQHSRQAGLDFWRFVGATERATVEALVALAAGAGSDALVARAERVAQMVDGSRQLHLKSYLTFHDGVVARLLVAAGHPQRARKRLELALAQAEESDMHFQDAELMRLLAHTVSDRRAREAELSDALEFARGQDAALFELRCLVDWFELVDGARRVELEGVISRIPGDASWPEVDHARRLLA
jgi:class 3 adenylate cyclase